MLPDTRPGISMDARQNTPSACARAGIWLPDTRPGIATDTCQKTFPPCCEADISLPDTRYGISADTCQVSLSQPDGSGCLAAALTTGQTSCEFLPCHSGARCMACSEAVDCQLLPLFPLVIRGKAERLASLASSPSSVQGNDTALASSSTPVAVGALVLLDEVLHEVHGQHAARCDRQGPREAPDAGAQLEDALLLNASEHRQHLRSSNGICEPWSMGLDGHSCASSLDSSSRTDA